MYITSSYHIYVLSIVSTHILNSIKKTSDRWGFKTQVKVLIGMLYIRNVFTYYVGLVHDVSINYTILQKIGFVHLNLPKIKVSEKQYLRKLYKKLCMRLKSQLDWRATKKTELLQN